MMRKLRRWLIENFLPEAAEKAFYREIDDLLSQLHKAEAELEEARFKNEKMGNFLRGIDYANKIAVQHHTVKGGNATHGER